MGTMAETARGAAAVPLEEIVTFAARAPSVHNSQPWLWQRRGDALDLLADWSRWLRRADPDGRDLLLSCGAALHHLRVASEAMGWSAVVEHQPDPEQPHLVASVSFRPVTAYAEAADELGALLARHTDRRRFAEWPVPDARLEAMAARGRRWGALVRIVEDESARTSLLDLTREADRRQHDDPGYVEELRSWFRPGARDGVPPANVPAGLTTVPQRFPRGDLDDPAAVVDASVPGIPAVLVVATSSDDALSHVRAGEALSDMWLQACRGGLVVVPLSQAVEVDETRRELRTGLLGDLACPQILLAVGFPSRADVPPPRSPRRSVADLLLE